jgi:hypothetical protein
MREGESIQPERFLRERDDPAGIVVAFIF